LNKKNNYQSIAILTCFFGKWPWYFPYFIQSCKFNPTIDFIIITDNDIKTLPDNVIIIQKQLKEIRVIASEKFGFGIPDFDAYKLCDFKPAYGFLFPDIIARYNFWGHGDIDVIYGDIRAFILEEMLSQYELITARHDFLSGTFTLFKNNEKMNTLFMKSKDYKKVFASSNHFCFDECNFLWKEIWELKQHETIFDLPFEIESMTHVVKKLQLENNLNAFFDFMIVEGTPGNLKWIAGKMIFKKQFEVLLYHLVKFKKQNTSSKVLNPVPNSFKLSPTRIYLG